MVSMSLDSDLMPVRSGAHKEITEDDHREKKYVLLLKEYDKKDKDLSFSQKKKYSVNLKHLIGKFNPTEVQKLLEKEQNDSYAISTDFISVKTERAQGKTLRPEKYLTGMTGDIVVYDIELEDENGRIAYIGKLMTDSEKLIEVETQWSSSESFLNDIKSQQNTYCESLQDKIKNKFEELASESDKTGSDFPSQKEEEKRNAKITNIDEQEMMRSNLKEFSVKSPKKIRRKGFKHKRMTEHEEKSSQNKTADKVGKELQNEFHTLLQDILTELEDAKKEGQESKVAYVNGLIEKISKLSKSPDSAMILLKSIPELGKSFLNEIVNKRLDLFTVSQKKLTGTLLEITDSGKEYNLEELIVAPKSIHNEMNISIPRYIQEYLYFAFLLREFQYNKKTAFAETNSNRIQQNQEQHSKSNDKADTRKLTSDDISLETEELSVKEKSEELVTCIVDIERIPHTYIKPPCAVTQTQSLVCSFKSLKQRPRIYFKPEDIEEALSEIINQSVRKGALRDASTIPPHVLDPTSHSFDLSKSDWRAYDTNTTQRRYVLPASSNEQVGNFFTRLASFSDWPIDSPYSALRLVGAGFLYDNSSSIIKCNFCEIQVDCTREIQEFHRRNMTAIQMHTELNSDCEYVKNMEIHRREDNDNTDYSMQSITRNVNDLTLNQQTVKSDHSGNDQITANSLISEPDNISDISHLEQRNTLESKKNIQTLNINGAMASQQSCSSLLQNVAVSRLNYGGNHPDIDQVNMETNNVSSINEESVTYALKHPEFKTIISRLETYRSWQIPEIQDQKVLTEAGFYFTGSRDIVRCFCCDIGLAEWEDDDEPWVEHARHSPNCEYLKDKKGEDYINSIQTDWKKIYNPKHPEFNETQARLDSFAGWPQELSQRPDVLAAAGFFYTGQNDVARCHYCDGGLREWEPHDDPWTEHARWFPFCKYLIKIKGLGYIEEVARMSRDGAMQLNSSELTNNQQGLIENSQQQSFNDGFESDEDPLSTTAAQTLVCMGYTRHNIQYVINIFIRENGQRSFRAEDLLEIIMDMEDRKEPFPVQSDVSSGRDPTQQDLEAENRRLKSEMMCITCKEKDRNMLFIPCGHRLFCEKCSSNVKRCPKCQKKVKKTVKIFLA